MAETKRAGDEIITSGDLEATATHQSDVQNLSEKVVGGDDALKILHTHYEPYTPEEEKKVLRKIDMHMCLMMLAINGIQFIDKNTITAAATYGIIGQAHLVGPQFSLLISIFYIGYLVAQYPTNILMQKYPLGKYITINFVLWGATLAATGAATNFATLATGRFFLGIFESCLNPGFVLITSSWWKREEQPARVALWYCANGLIGAPSGLLFYGIAHITNTSLFAYQWMFIILGIITVIFGISLWWILPDSPLTATFLTDRERIIAIERLKTNNTGIKNTQVKKAQIVETFRDPKVWMLVAAIFFHNMTNALQTSFTGLIIMGLGYSSFEAILLSIPPGIVQAVSMLVFGFFLATKWGQQKRIFVIIFCYLPGVAACLILFLSPIQQSTKSAHLFAVIIIPMVATSAGIMYSILASNLAGYTKKTTAGALFFAANAVSNIVGPQTFLSSESPRYQTGVAVSLTSFGINIVLFSVLYLVYSKANKGRDADPTAVVDEDSTADLVNAFSDQTDLVNRKMRYKM